MQPFFFGPAERQHYGAWHPAQGQRRRLGVLLLTSYGQETSRAYRLLRVLAERLAMQGVDAMRFDWSGCGDSAGADDEANLSAWRQDAALAHAELLARAQPERMVWVGVRLGATVALQAGPALTHELVLLDPVLDGAALMHTWHQAHLHNLGERFPPTNVLQSALLQAVPDPLAGEVMGFGLSPAFAAELQALRPADLPLPAGCHADVLTHGETAGLASWLAAQPAGTVSHQSLPQSLPWAAMDGSGTPLVPAPVLQALLQRCLK
ncbi:MAG: alpha/beta hydrolase [Proteobacteria bacterium]|nr:alpha/beta hydrolase [Pseudomonadota bacterium]